MEKEIWKDIYFLQDGIEYDYRNLYQVSNFGNIKSLNYNKTGKEKIMKLSKNTNGYLDIMLFKNKKHKIFRVHRLVAHMFLSETYFDGAEINHKDENKENNYVDNLEWCNRRENCNYGNRNKNISKNNYIHNIEKEKHPMYGKTYENSPLSKKVSQFDLDGNLIKIWNCIKEAEEKLKINNISACCRYKRKSAGGFIWRYYESGDENE